MAINKTDFWYKYRPRKFSDFLGNKRVIQSLKNIIPNKIPSGIILHGSPGLGKTSLAYAFAKASNCLNFNGDICDECENCIEIEGSFPNDCVMLGIHVHDSQLIDANRIDRIIKNDLLYIQFGRLGKDIHIFDEFGRIVGGSQQKFLTPLEKNPHVIFIFCQIDISSLEDAFQQRCQLILKVTRPEMDEIIPWLERICELEGITIKEREALMRLSGEADRTPRECLRLLQNISLLQEPLTVNMIKEISRNKRSVKDDPPAL